MNVVMLSACILVSLAISLGQVLFKLAADDVVVRLKSSIVIAVLSPWLLFAIVIYAIATALWIFVLANMPLNKAYPFILLGAALVPVLSTLLLGESLTAMYIAGYICLLVGLLLIQFA